MYRFAEDVRTTFATSVEGRRPGEAEPFYTIMLNERDALIRAATFGFWTLAEAEKYVADLARFVNDSRRRYGRAKVLVDRRATPVQRPEVASRFGKANQDLYRPEDRLALVVESNLAKGQMRRQFVHEGSKAFLSFEAAETWLGAVA